MTTIMVVKLLPTAANTWERVYDLFHIEKLDGATLFHCKDKLKRTEEYCKNNAPLDLEIFVKISEDLTIFSENHIGLLNRITINFTKRKLNIDSLTVSESAIKGVFKFTIVV